MKNLLAARSSTLRKESRPTLSKPIIKSSFAFPSGAIADEIARTIATKPVEIPKPTPEPIVEEDPAVVEPEVETLLNSFVHNQFLWLWGMSVFSMNIVAFLIYYWYLKKLADDGFDVKCPDTALAPSLWT